MVVAGYTKIVALLGVLLLRVFLAPIGATSTQVAAMTAAWEVGAPPERGWTVGDRIPLRLKATYPAGFELTLPELPENWGPFEVREQTLVGPLPAENGENGTYTLIREATVTLWAPGEYQTPELVVQYQDGAGERHELTVPPAAVMVVSVLEPGETEKRDLKSQIWLPTPPVWPWILGAAALAALVATGGWAWWRQRARAARAPKAIVAFDPRPAHQIAYEELERLAALDLPAQRRFKEHYTLLADIMRIYVEGRYHIPALDMTTEEIMDAFERLRPDRRHISLFRELLQEADLAKFARFRPAPDHARAAVDHARHIVDVTRLAEEPTAPPDEPVRAGLQASGTRREG